MSIHKIFGANVHEGASVTVHEIPRFGIKIQTWISRIDTANQSGNLTESSLLYEFVDADDSDEEWNLARSITHALEGLILAQACEGIDITTPKYAQALETAIEGMVNHLF